MKQKLLTQAIAAALGAMFATRAHTQDIAITYRMSGGNPGDVNRTHPASIIPGLLNTSVQTPRLVGDPVLVDTATNSYRGFVTGDTTTPIIIDGILVRSFPVQQTANGMTSTFGAAAPAAGQPCDILEEGRIMVKVNSGAAPTKKGTVYVWFAANSGAHVQGGIESAATGGSTALITNAEFVGPPDANGNAEIVVWKQH